MNLSEQALTLIGSGLVTAFGLVAWLVKAYLQGKNERIKELQDENRDLEAKLQTTEAEAKTCRVARDEADQRTAEMARSVAPLHSTTSELKGEIERLKKLSDQHKLEGEKYIAAARDEHRKRKDAESRAEQAVASANESKVALLEAEKLAKVRELSLHNQLNAEKAARRDSETAALRICKERDALSALVDRLRGENADQREALEAYEKQIEAISQQDGRVWEGRPRPSVPVFVPLAKRGTATREGTPIISLLNLKGGVGKTTITANLGGYFGGFLDEHPEKRVLLIDLDHQRSLSNLLLSKKERIRSVTAHTIQRFLLAPEKTGQTLLDCSRPVPGLDRCHIITNANPIDGTVRGLDGLEMQLMSEWLVKPDVPDVRFLLREALQSDIVRDQFDYVFIDCPPRLTTACINALAASDYLLIPCQTEAVSLASVDHLLQLLQPLRACDLLSNLRILGVLASMVPTAGLAEGSIERTAFSDKKKVASKLWGGQLHFFKTMLKRDENYAKASRFLENDDPLRLGIYYTQIQNDFSSLTTEIQNRIKHENRDVAGVLA